jgi:SAM-dependent methyltransferase
MSSERAYPLDYQAGAYPYLERPNAVLVSLVGEYVLARHGAPRVLDVGCGAGANARALRARCAQAQVLGIEPNQHAAELAGQACDEVFCGTLEQWLASTPNRRFECVLMSDVLEHVVDPVHLLQSLAELPGTRDAIWIVSVPNYGVWYNRVRTLVGRFEYAWSGLYDRTHVRFFTRGSLRRLLRYCSFWLLTDRCSPSLVQSLAPWLRRRFAESWQAGQHLALNDSGAYRAYQQLVEPLETRICGLWPELLGFQIIAVARR